MRGLLLEFLICFTWVAMLYSLAHFTVWGQQEPFLWGWVGGSGYSIYFFGKYQKRPK